MKPGRRSVRDRTIPRRLFPCPPVSVQSASAFIRHLRDDAALREALAADYEPSDGLEPLLRAGREAGFDFTADDLREAFRFETGLRWLALRMAAGD